jgi:hypothetical protein
VNDANWGKHRTEDTEDAEGDWGLVVDNVDTGASGGERREWGKHRTEDTEDTEEDWGLVVDRWTPGLQG